MANSVLRCDKDNTAWAMSSSTSPVTHDDSVHMWFGSGEACKTGHSQCHFPSKEPPKRFRHLSHLTPLRLPTPATCNYKKWWWFGEGSWLKPWSSSASSRLACHLLGRTGFCKEVEEVIISILILILYLNLILSLLTQGMPSHFSPWKNHSVAPLTLHSPPGVSPHHCVNGMG